jgi:RNA-binding protein
LAHKLDPVVHIGTGGVTDAVVTSVEEALSSRELLKVRVLDRAPEDAKTTARQLEARMADVQVPLTTGRTFVLYRAFAEEPEIKLP